MGFALHYIRNRESGAKVADVLFGFEIALTNCVHVRRHLCINIPVVTTLTTAAFSWFCSLKDLRLQIKRTSGSFRLAMASAPEWSLKSMEASVGSDLEGEKAALMLKKLASREADRRAQLNQLAENSRQRHCEPPIIPAIYSRPSPPVHD